jgi:rod shape-determining protein MreD
MIRRLLIAVLLAGALLGDATMGVLQPARGRPPQLTLAVVAVVALGGGARTGMATGFATGLVVDLLAGPASLAGTFALVGVVVGGAVGSARRRAESHMAGHVVASGALAVAGGGALSVGLHALAGVDVGDVVGSVLVIGALTGATVTPLVLRIARWPLLESSSTS